MKHKFFYFLMMIISLFYFAVNDTWAINVANGLCQEKASDVGSSYTDTIRVVNNSKKPAAVKIYQTDYMFFSDGSNQFGDPGKDSRSNAQWIEQLPQQITIPPEQTSLIQYSVNIPDNQTLSGSYWSMIMVEEINEEDLEALSSGDKKRLGIQQLVRYGIQVVTHIGSSGIRQLEFRGLKFSKTNDKQVLNIDVENSGTRALRTLFWVDFYAEEGRYAKKINGEQRRIYPECSIMQKLDISEIPPGAYKAVIVADAGEETVFGTSFSIKIDE